MNTGDIIEEARRIGMTCLPTIAIFVVVMTALSATVDVMGWGLNGGDLLVNIIALVAGYLLLIEIIKASRLAPDGPTNGFGTYFGLGILTGLAIAFGFILLIVPGVFLLVRWSAIYGFAFAGGKGVTEAMGASWDATKEHFWPILLALLLPMAVYIVALLVMFMGLDEAAETSSIGAALVSNVLLYSASVASTLLGLGIYSLVSGGEHGLADVFE